MTAVGKPALSLVLWFQRQYMCFIELYQPTWLFWLLIWPASLPIHSFPVAGMELTELKLQYFHVYCCHSSDSGVNFALVELLPAGFQSGVETVFLFEWVLFIHEFLFCTILSTSHPPQCNCKILSRLWPHVVFFDGKCKWLTLKWGVWLKFSKAIHRVLDSPICLCRIAYTLGARFHTCIQNGVRCMQKNLTVCDPKENSGWSLMHCTLHTDRARPERSVLSLDTVVWICCLKMSSVSRCHQKEGWSSTWESKQTMCL